jgi:predicted dehydrogenase
VARVNVALVGCGNIAPRYARTIAAEPRLRLTGATDVVPGRAAALVGEFGGVEYDSLEALLADDAVETVVNLTAPQVHAEVTARSLEVGKHVHTEKPVARRYEEARELAALAARRGVRLSCAPATLLGEAQQTAWKLVREGALGTVRVAYAEANWGRIESWHPSPQALYQVGPLVDVGIYPLTILTAIFGPARRVLAYGTILERDRTTRDGVAFRLGYPDFTIAVVELDSGVVVRLTATFWVGAGKQRGIEFHGDAGSLYLASWAEFDSRLESSVDGEEYTAIPLVRQPYRGIHWSRALTDLAEALEEGRPHRAGAEHAAHVVEALSAIELSLERGGAVDVESSFEPPWPMEWAGS